MLKRGLVWRDGHEAVGHQEGQVGEVERLAVRQAHSLQGPGHHLRSLEVLGPLQRATSIATTVREATRWKYSGPILTEY